MKTTTRSCLFDLPVEEMYTRQKISTPHQLICLSIYPYVSQYKVSFEIFLNMYRENRFGDNTNNFNYIRFAADAVLSRFRTHDRFRVPHSVPNM